MAEVSGISILVAVYNYSIAPLADNLILQMKQLAIPCELLLLDDCSTDENTTKENKQLAKKIEVSYEVLPKNIGRAAIRNRLAEKAQFSHLLFIDVDSKVPTKQYLENYLRKCTEAKVLVGGTIYEKSFRSVHSLRHKYGKQREELSATIRNKNPYDTITLNNLLVEKEIYLRYPLDEQLTQYGHEDTKFGYVLSQNTITLLHIDNPVYHIGLEENRIFLNKSKQAVENFAILVQQGYGKNSKLYTTFCQLKKWKMTTVFQKTIELFSLPIERQLLGANPSIFLFDLWKLYWFCVYMRKVK